MSFWNKLSSTLSGIFSKDTIAIEKKVINKEKVEDKEKLNEKVEFISEFDSLKKHLSDAFNTLSSMDEYWDAIVAIEAVGTSCASSDKDFSDKERKEIRKFIHSINKNQNMPSSIKEKIDNLYENPLPLNKAFLLAKETKIEMSVFEELVDLVMHVDGIKFEEKVVLNAWHNFKRSA